MKPHLFFLLLSLVISGVTLHAQDTLKRVVRVVDFGTDSTKKADTVNTPPLAHPHKGWTNPTPVHAFGFGGDFYPFHGHVLQGNGTYYDYSGLNGALTGHYFMYRSFKQLAEHWSVGGAVGVSLGVFYANSHKLLAMKAPLDIELRGGNGSSDEEESIVSFGIGAGIVPVYLHLGTELSNNHTYVAPVFITHFGIGGGALRLEYAPRKLLVRPLPRSKVYYSNFLACIIFYMN